MNTSMTMIVCSNPGCTNKFPKEGNRKYCCSRCQEEAYQERKEIALIIPRYWREKGDPETFNRFNEIADLSPVTAKLVKMLAQEHGPGAAGQAVHIAWHAVHGTEAQQTGQPSLLAAAQSDSGQRS